MGDGSRFDGVIQKRLSFGGILRSFRSVKFVSLVWVLCADDPKSAVGLFPFCFSLPNLRVRKCAEFSEGLMSSVLAKRLGLLRMQHAVKGRILTILVL